MAAKLAIARNADRLPLEVIYCHIEEEHPDNLRFLTDCERWLGVPIKVLRNEKFGGSIYRVFEHEKYIVGRFGAPCTRALKKKVRESYQRPGDVHVFGYHVGEEDRMNRMIDANADVREWVPLMDAGLDKADCLAMVARAGIELPAMYRLGYKNANCIGCVKAGAGYWNKIRVDFPEAFDRMARLERKIGARICKQDGQLIYLDELDPATGDPVKDQPSECGIFCYMAEQEIAACEV